MARDPLHNYDSGGDGVNAGGARDNEESPPLPLVAFPATLAQDLLREATQVSGSAAAQLFHEAARIHAFQFDDSKTAVDLWSRAAAADPGFLPAVRALRCHALFLLDDAKAAKALLVEACASENPDDRVDLMLMAGRLLNGIGNADEASSVLAEAAQQCPASFAAAEERLFDPAVQGDRASLAEAYVRCATTAADPTLSSHFLAAASAIYEEALGKLDRAGALALEAFHLLPTDPLLQTGARRHAERLGQTEALAEILRAMTEHLNGAPAVEALHALALTEERLSNLDAAVVAMKRATTESPRNPRLVAELARLLEAASRYEEASETLALLASEYAADDEPRNRAEAISALLRRAEIEETKLSHLALAVEACRAALGFDPRHRAALSLLGRLSARLGDAHGLAAAFLGEAEAADLDGERAQRLFRAGEVFEARLNLPDEAIRRYRDALAADPEFGPARAALERVYERESRWGELNDLLEADLTSTSEDSVLHSEGRWRLEKLERRAEILDVHLDDPVRAQKAWKEVLAHAPGYLPAVRAVARLSQRQGRFDELVGLYRSEALRTNGSNAADLLQRAASLLEHQLNRPLEAIAAYRESLAKDPSLASASHALERLYRSRGEHAELARLLGERAAHSTLLERADALTELGRLYEEKLWDRPTAMASYEEALRALPSHLPALVALDRLYAETGRTEQLLKLRQEDCGDHQPLLRAERLLRLAQLYVDRLLDPESALSILNELHRAQPKSPSSLILEARLAEEPERRASARIALGHFARNPRTKAALFAAGSVEARPPRAREEALERAASLIPVSELLAPVAERAFLKAQEHSERAALCEDLAQRASDASSRVDWMLRSAESFEATGELDRALRLVANSLEELPLHIPALEFAFRMNARLGDSTAAQGAAVALAEALRDPQWKERAALYGETRSTEEAPDLGPQNADELPLLEVEPGPSPGAEEELTSAPPTIASTDGEAWAILALATGVAREPTRRTDAPIWDGLVPDEEPEELLDTPNRADAPPLGSASIPTIDAVLIPESSERPAEEEAKAEAVPAPEGPETLERLGRVHLANGRLEEAAAVLRRLTQLPEVDPSLAAARLVDLADVEERLGHADASLSALRSALGHEPSNAEAFRRLAHFDAGPASPAEVAYALVEVARNTSSPKLASEAFLEAARITAGPLRSRPRAIDHLRASLESDPSRDDARVFLAEQLEMESPDIAIGEHRILLRRDPFRASSWAALFRIFEHSHNHDRAYVCASVLRWLGEPAPGPNAERLLLEGDRQSLPPPPPLTDDDWRPLKDPREDESLAALFAHAGEALAEVFSGAASDRGPPLPADHPFRRVMADLARALGTPDFELCTSLPGQVAVLPGARPCVLVGADLSRRTTAREQRFLLGRAVARLKYHTGLLESAPGEALSAALSAVVSQIDPAFPREIELDPAISRRVNRALSRKIRRSIEEPARALAKGAIDLATFRAAAAATADRVGLVLCGDVPTAMAVIVREPGVRVEASDIQRDARKREETRALLAFAMEEIHFDLRQKLRVAVA